MSKGIALVTGASSGIGAELARLCASAGFDLILVARNAGALDKLADSLRGSHGVAVRTIAADLADQSTPRSIFQQTGPVDILINNAGFGLRGAYFQTDWEAESRMIQVNVTALAHLTKLYLPGMIARRSGRILNVASTAAFVPGPFMAMYYATKGFVFSFSQSIADEVEGTGVSVTVLCPGPTRTNFFEAAGITNSSLQKGPSMSAEAAAKEGFDAMMQGKVEIIAGRRNRWMIWGTRFAPRSMLRKITRRLNLDV